MRLRVFASLAIVTVLLQTCVLPSSPAVVVAQGAPPAPISLVPGPAAAEPEVAAAVLAAMIGAQAGLPAMKYIAITDVRAAPGWRLVSVAGLQDLAPGGSWNLTLNGSWLGLVSVQQGADGRWIAAVQGTPDFVAMLPAVPPTLLDARAKQDLAPVPGRGPLPAPAFRFPWQPGTEMFYGALGVHPSDFTGWVAGWKAVDFLSDGDIDNGHAPNRLLASAPGTIGALCPDSHSVAIRMDYDGNPQLLYLHLINNPGLHTGASFETGDELGQLRTGAFNDFCGYANQGSQWFHVHYAFPAASGTWLIEDWTLNLADQAWHKGAEARGPGSWLLAGPLPAPVLASPLPGAVEPAGYHLELTWNAVSGANGYQVAWWGGPYTNTQPLGWFSGTSYDIGPVEPGTYGWRVRARDAAGPGAWSATGQFTITAVLVSRPLVISPTLTQPDQPVAAQFAISNTTGQPVTLPAVTVRALSPGCLDPSCAQAADFPSQEQIHLAPGQAYTYTGVRSFTIGGNYMALPAYQDMAGIWHYAIPAANQVPFAIEPALQTRGYLPIIADPRSGR